LLTGCYPRRVGNEIWVHRADSRSGIAPDELTIAELLKTGGYATACIGKWHLGFQEPFLPRNQGFDHYFGLLHNLDPVEIVYFEDQGGVPLIRNGEVVKRPADPAELTKLYTDEAIQFIEQNKDRPFFLYLPHTMLHNPLGVSEEFKGSSNWGEYGDAIQELDHNVGRIFDTLKQLKIANNTIVVYRLSGEAPFPAAIHDCKAAVRFLRAHAKEHGIDSENIGAIGLSAGGHLTALLATSAGVDELEGEGGNAEFSSAIQAAVPMGAQTDLLSVRTRDISRIEERGKIWRQFLGGTLEERPDTYRLASPLNHLDKNDPPCWLISGETDDPSTHADAFRARMEQLGIPSALTVIKAAPHPFLGKQVWFDEMIDVADGFFSKHLKNRNSGAAER
jgi:dienelactone hydrolase